MLEMVWRGLILVDMGTGITMEQLLKYTVWLAREDQMLTRVSEMLRHQYSTILSRNIRIRCLTKTASLPTGPNTGS